MLDIEWIKCCIYQLDCFRIEYDASKLKFYQENWEPDEEERQQQVMQKLLFGLRGKNLVNLVVMLILPPATIILQTSSCIRETMRVM